MIVTEIQEMLADLQIYTFASKFIGVHAFHNAISRSCVLFNKSAKAKMIKNSFADTWGQADMLTTRQSTRDKKRNGEKAKKKRCGFIMFVFESAAASCGIPNYSLERLFRWIKMGQT